MEAKKWMNAKRLGAREPLKVICTQRTDGNTKTALANMLMADIVLQCGHVSNMESLTWFLPVERAGGARRWRTKARAIRAVSWQLLCHCGSPKGRWIRQKQPPSPPATRKIVRDNDNDLPLFLLLLFKCFCSVLFWGRCILLKCMLCSVNEMRTGPQRTKASGEKNRAHTTGHTTNKENAAANTMDKSMCIFLWLCLLFVILLARSPVSLGHGSSFNRAPLDPIRVRWLVGSPTDYLSISDITRNFRTCYSGWYERIIETRVGHGFYLPIWWFVGLLWIQNFNQAEAASCRHTHS